MADNLSFKRTILITGCKTAHFHLKMDHRMAQQRERRLIEHPVQSPWKKNGPHRRHVLDIMAIILKTDLKKAVVDQP